MKVKLTYFKKSGKCYTQDSYQSEKTTFFEVIREVQEMQVLKKLPGLISGKWEYPILVEVDSLPHLIF